MNTRQAVLTRIERYLRKTKMSASAFSLAVTNDHRWLGRLRDGKGINLTKIEAAERFMADYPRGLPERVRA